MGLAGFANWFDRKYFRLSWWLALIAGLMALVMMVVLIMEIILRKLGSPTEITTEFTELAVMYAFLLPMAFAELDHGMIRFTVLVNRFSPQVVSSFQLISSLSAAIFGALLFKAGLDYLLISPHTSYPLTHVPLQVQRGLIPVCAGLLFTAGVINVTKDILALRAKQ